MWEIPLPGPNWLEPPSSGKASVDLGSISKGPAHRSFTTSGTHYPCVIAGSFSIPGANPPHVTCVLNACTLSLSLFPKQPIVLVSPAVVLLLRFVFISYYVYVCVCCGGSSMHM